MLALFACDCASVQQVCTLRVAQGKWAEVDKKWSQALARNQLGHGGPLRCNICSGAIRTSDFHRSAVQAIKLYTEKLKGTWLVCCEVPLEIGVKWSARVDVLLVPTGAAAWRDTIAIEINPSQHDVNPCRNGLSARGAEERADTYDECKHNRCVGLGMQFLYLGCGARAVCSTWLDRLDTAVRYTGAHPLRTLELLLQLLVADAELLQALVPEAHAVPLLKLHRGA